MIVGEERLARRAIAVACSRVYQYAFDRAPSVLAPSDRFEMARADAQRVMAQMVEFKPLGDRPQRVLVGPTWKPV